MSSILPILQELHHGHGVREAVNSTIARLTRQLEGDIAVSIRLDARRMRSLDNSLHRDGQEFCECPEIQGHRLAREVRIGTRAEWNHNFQPRPVAVSRRFLERFELPDRETVEWMSHFPASHHLAVPLLHAGEMHGEIVVPIKERFRALERATQASGIATRLAPLWLLGNLLRDHFGLDSGNQVEGLLPGCRQTLALLLKEDFPEKVLHVRDQSLLARLRIAIKKGDGELAATRLPRIVLASFDSLVHRGIADLLSDSPSASAVIVGYCGLEREAERLCARFRPDVLVIDVSTADSAAALETIRRVFHRGQQVRILCLLPRIGDELLAQLTRAGAAGVILKDRINDEFQCAVESLAEGRPYFGIGVMERVGARLGECLLSPRELEVLRLASRGRTNGEIGKLCGISERTVRFHIENARPKLGARSRHEAIQAVVAERLV